MNGSSEKLKKAFCQQISDWYSDVAGNETDHRKIEVIRFINTMIFNRLAREKGAIFEDPAISAAKDKVAELLDIIESLPYQALDPEMMGRVFENLISIRKATGSYYTPVEIVDFMSAVSLKSYFRKHLEKGADIDKKLEVLFSDEMPDNPFNSKRSEELKKLIENVKIIDPSVGSGAFIIGMLNKMMFILNKISPIDKSGNYVRKLNIIRNSLYGVDIQDVAVEITISRLFLSLLEENRSIKSLENVNIIHGNSLKSEVFEHERFDIVIGNPPYNAELTDDEKKYYKANFESVRSGRQDTSAMFVELAYRIGKPSMELAYILPYRLFSRKRNHGQFQKYVLDCYSIRKILYLGSYPGFGANDEFMILLMSSGVEAGNTVEIAFKPDISSTSQKFFKISQDLFAQNGEINLNLVIFNGELISKIKNDSIGLGSICNVRDGIIPFIRNELIKRERLDERYERFAGVAGKYVLNRYYFRSDELYLCYDINEAKKHITDAGELRKVQLRKREIFESRKIITSQNSAIIKGTIDENRIFVSNSIHSTYLKKEYTGRFFLEYILAIMNSALINYFHNSLRLKATDLHPQILISTLKQIPIKDISKYEQKPFVALVRKITAITSDPGYLKNLVKQKQVKKHEDQIDRLVCDLYSITSEEIKVVINY